MTGALIIEYLGFKSRALVREYTFSVREPGIDAREFTLTIANEAFANHRARFQDAPDICSQRLRRELASGPGAIPKTHYRITDAELEDYDHNHGHKPARGSFSPRPARSA